MTDPNEYGKALFLLTEELGSTEGALSDAREISRLMRENPSYKNLLDTPALPAAEKLGLIDEAFGGADESVKNLLKILCERHAAYLFPAVAKAFEAEYDEARGILHADAVTAIALTEAQSAQITEKLARETGKTVLLRNVVDPSILGGVKLRYAGVQLDGSVKCRLDRIERSLKSAIL